MKKPGVVVLVYGLLVLIGGFIGHYKASSMASLISGCVFGALLISIAWAIFKQKKSAIYMALAVSFILDAFFTYRVILTHKFMPSGMMGIISIAVILMLSIYLKKKKAVTG